MTATLQPSPPQEPRPLQAGDHVFLVDGSSFVFRAYFQSIRQDAKYNYRSDRLPTGAVRLFCTKLFQFIREGAAGIKPTHLAIIFDKSENSFRKELYPAYKAQPLRAAGRPRAAVPADARPCGPSACSPSSRTPTRPTTSSPPMPPRPGPRRRRADHLRRQGPDAAHRAGRRHVRPGVRRPGQAGSRAERHDRRRRWSTISACRRTSSSTCRRSPAIPPTTCRARRASA